MGAVGHVGPDARVTLGQDVGGAQPAVVLVDPQEAGLHLEQTHHVDDGVDGGQDRTLGQGDVEVRDLPLGDADHAHGPEADVAEGYTRIVTFVSGQPQRHRDNGEDAPRPQLCCGADGDDLDHATVDVVVVAHRVGREDHGHARRGHRAVDQVDRAGGRPLGRRARVGLDDRPVLGDEAEGAGPQGGHGQAELQARPPDEGRVDGPHALAVAGAERVGQGVEVQDGTAARAQLPAHTGEPEDGAGDEAQDVALAAAPGPTRPAPLPPVGRSRRGHDLAAGEHGGGREGKRRAGALGDLLVDLAAERGAVESGEPRLLAEDVPGVGPGQHVGLDLVDPLRELRERAGLRQHGGGDGAGGGRGDDVGHDPLDADQVLQHADLEGPLGASSGEDERGGAG
ncbi:MAG TPA: hypothetical protein VKA05_06720, partial [Acidimicrobiales bacterium]|nr:hypothetical protein [Acidimicrobiales bacterium]